MKSKSKDVQENWKDVDLNLTFEVDFRLQVSNFGNLRTVNKHDEFKTTKASHLRGFRTVNRTFYRPRTKKEEKLFVKYKYELSEAKAEIAKEKKEIKELKYKSDVRSKKREGIVALEKEFNKQKRAYQKFLLEDRKSRAITRSWLLHKLVATYFCKPKSKNHTYIIHLDGNKENNKSTNLKWATLDEANLYKYQRKSIDKPKLSYKLTIEKVIEIKNELKDSMAFNTNDLLKKYKISISQLRRIKNKETWNFVKI